MTATYKQHKNDYQCWRPLSSPFVNTVYIHADESMTSAQLWEYHERNGSNLGAVEALRRGEGGGGATGE